MPKNYFVFCSTDEDQTTYWSVEEGWTPEEGRATRYDSSILTMGSTLPEGTGAILEKSSEGKDVRFFGPLSLPLWVGVPWFEALTFA